MELKVYLRHTDTCVYLVYRINPIKRTGSCIFKKGRYLEHKV